MRKKKKHIAELAGFAANDYHQLFTLSANSEKIASASSRTTSFSAANSFWADRSSSDFPHAGLVGARVASQIAPHLWDVDAGIPQMKSLSRFFRAAG